MDALVVVLAAGGGACTTDTGAGGGGLAVSGAGGCWVMLAGGWFQGPGAEVWACVGGRGWVGRTGGGGTVAP